MTNDLVAALREARQWIGLIADSKPRQSILARLDAALSAASGEASGPAPNEVKLEPGWLLRDVRQASERIHPDHRHVPPKAPYVERANELTDEQLREWIAEHERAPWIVDEKKHPQNIYGTRLLAILKELQSLRAVRAVIRGAIDSARAEGIAASQVELEAAKEALYPLTRIADAYDANELDDEARKHWGVNDEFTNSVPLEEIEIYQGRGGKRLLTLADCFKARAAISKMEKS